MSTGGATVLTTLDLVLVLGVAVLVVGLVGHLLVGDLVRRVVALNVASGGVMIVLLGLAVRGTRPDPVPQALVLTGIVIMAAITGVALALVRRVESVDDELGEDQDPDQDLEPGAGVRP